MLVVVVKTSTKRQLVVKSCSFQRFWWIVHIAFTIFYGGICLTRILRSFSEGVFLFRFVTNIQLFLLFSVCALILHSKTRAFCLKFLLLPALNLSWLVLAGRCGFDMMLGVSWTLMMETAHPSGAPQQLREIYDLAVHFLPLFVLLRIHSFFYDEFTKTQSKLSSTEEFWNVFAAYFLIMIWGMFYNPFQTYLMPQTGMTTLIFYGGNLIFLLCTSLLLSPSLAKGFGFTFTRRRVPAVGLVVTFLTILLLVDIYGISIIFRFPIAMACLLILIFYVGCLMKENWSAYLMLPVYVFSAASFISIKVLLSSVDDYEFLVVGLRDIDLFPYFSTAMGLFIGLIFPLLTLTVNDYLVNKEMRSSFIAQVFRKNRDSKIFFLFKGLGGVIFMIILILIDRFTDVHYLMYDAGDESNSITMSITFVCSYLLAVKSWPAFDDDDSCETTA